MWVIGVRSFAAEIADWAADAGLGPRGFLDPADDPPGQPEAHGLPVRPLSDGRGDEAILGTGETDRRQTVKRATAAGIVVRGVVHPSAHVSGEATVERSVVIGPHVVIGAFAAVGEHAVLGRGALVGHHSTLGAFVTLGPGANVAGNTCVEEGAEIAMGAIVRDHQRVGAWARVAMGSVVVSDVARGTEVRGIPARPPRT